MICLVMTYLTMMHLVMIHKVNSNVTESADVLFDSTFSDPS